MSAPRPVLRHRYRDQLPDPDLYPQVAGCDVPCPEHGVAVNVRCPCMVTTADGAVYTDRSSTRMRAAHQCQHTVLARIPGIALTSGTRMVSHFTALHAAGTHRVGITVWELPPEKCEPDTWAVTLVQMREGLPDVFAQRYPDGALMPYRDMVRVLALWGGAAPSVRAGVESVTGFLARRRTADRLHTLAQELWATSAGLVPARADGRFEVAGFTEPYPGFWPGEAVERALVSADVSRLWPYLPA